MDRVGMTIVGVVLIVSSIPLIFRKVPRNGVYGVRFSETLADDYVWYEVNATGGRDFLVVGCALMALARWAPMTQIEMLVITLGGVLGAAAVSWRRARGLARARRVAAGPGPSLGERLRK
jgi:uncharacterized membrane protein